MKLKVAMVHLGCPKNLIDHEVMLKLIDQAGLEITKNTQLADVVVVNTCGFIEEAKEESIDTILQFAILKKSNLKRKLIVTGCLVQRYAEELIKDIPEIDAVIGTGALNSICHVIRKVVRGKRVVEVCDPGGSLEESNFRIRCTPFYTSYLKIAEGCNNRCSYCAIPIIRGAYRSRRCESIIKEATNLVKEGVKELILIAQDTSYYGKDLYGNYYLSFLLQKIARINKLKWIRIMYCYPTHITDELLQVIASEPAICKYLDIPLQHASSEILYRMGRREKRSELEALIKKIRDQVPGICLRSTFIVGFPGETEDNFLELLDFIETQELDWVGVFKYSLEDSTKASTFPNQISEEVKEERYHQLMIVQREITRRRIKKWIGQKVEVLVEGKSNSSTELYYGRTAWQAPEIDGMVYFKAKNVQVGQFVPVLIRAIDDYDLIGERENEYC